MVQSCRREIAAATEERLLAMVEKPKRRQVLLQWSAEVIKGGHAEAQRSAEAKAPANILKAMLDKTFKSKSIQQEILDEINLPVPFQYFHIVNVMLSVNLLLWAYIMGCTQSIWGTLVFVYCSLLVVGMLELANEMTMPFGCGDVDFPVELWFLHTYDNVVLMLNLDSPVRGGDLKKILEQERKLEPNDHENAIRTERTSGIALRRPQNFIDAQAASSYTPLRQNEFRELERVTPNSEMNTQQDAVKKPTSGQNEDDEDEDDGDDE